MSYDNKNSFFYPPKVIGLFLTFGFLMVAAVSAATAAASQTLVFADGSCLQSKHNGDVHVSFRGGRSKSDTKRI